MSDQLVPRKSEVSSFLDRVVAFGVHHKILYPARRQEISHKMTALFRPLCQKFGMNPEATGEALQLCQYLVTLVSIELEIRSRGNLEFAAAILFGEDPRQLCESALKRIDGLRADFLEFRQKRTAQFVSASREIDGAIVIIAYAQEPSDELVRALVIRDARTNPWQAAMEMISTASDMAGMEMLISAYKRELSVSRKHLPWKEIVSAFGLKTVPSDFLLQTSADITLEMLLTTLSISLLLRGRGAGRPCLSWRTLQKFAGIMDTLEFQNSARIAMQKYLASLATAPSEEEKTLLLQMWDRTLDRLRLFLPAKKYRYTDVGPWAEIVILSVKERGRVKNSAFVKAQEILDLQRGIPEAVELDKPGALKLALMHFPWGRLPSEDYGLVSRVEEGYEPAQIIRSIPMNAYVVGLILDVWDAWQDAEKRLLLNRILRESSAEFWKELAPHADALKGPANKRQLALLKQKLVG
jgi:hypothetical protein